MGHTWLLLFLACERTSTRGETTTNTRHTTNSSRRCDGPTATGDGTSATPTPTPKQAHEQRGNMSSAKHYKHNARSPSGAPTMATKGAQQLPPNGLALAAWLAPPGQAHTRHKERATSATHQVGHHSGMAAPRT